MLHRCCTDGFDGFIIQHLGAIILTAFHHHHHHIIIMCTTTTSPLIVDFPPSARHTSTTAATTIMKNNKHTTIRISEYAELYYIQQDYDTVDPSDLWYTPQDKVQLKKQLAYDAYRARKALIESPNHTITEDRLCACIGLESVLSTLSTTQSQRATTTHRRAQKAQHSTTIVSMQDTCSDEDLRQISLQSSKHTRRRAHKLAVTYAASGQKISR